MSGGSFNYLYTQTPGQVLDSEELQRMADEIRELGYDAKDVASRTQALVELRDRVAAEIEALGPVWQAVEWWRSCDWSRDQVLIAIGAYRERQRQVR